MKKHFLGVMIALLALAAQSSAQQTADYHNRLNYRLDLRAIEVDYVPICAGDLPLTITPPAFGINVIGRAANNLNSGVGLVIH